MSSTRSRTSPLRTNIAAMSLVQISNYLLPLITLPYLTRVLGAEAFGKVAFAQILMSYLVLLVDYGFSWSATRAVAADRNDSEKISLIFTATWATQWLLLALAMAIAVPTILLADRLRPDAWLYAAGFTSVIGGTLFPVWFLQGLERLEVVAMLQLVARILALPAIFLLIGEPEDGIWVLLINGAASILSGIAALAWLWRQRVVRWAWPGWLNLFDAIRDGGPLFASRISISLYTTLVPIVLGWVAGPVALGYFHLADKLRSAGQALLSPLSQALFPRLSHLANTDGAAAFKLIRRSALATIFIGGLSSGALWLFADWLIVILGGPQFGPAATVLQLLSPLPLIIGLSNLLGVQMMLPRGLNAAFNGILLTAAATSLALIWPMASHWGAEGAAATILLVEFMVTSCMTAILWHKGLLKPETWSTR
ncbi:flippase [Thauera aminoaromatica]|uniref:flippase n=1 Tax=Thauera aminoaromatica TaxID=164330 RepID=UPI002354A8E1|nr:flippase [Thauera aminoaromatica]MCK6398240.1 flippase [Thauera aminoaromatica]